MRIRIPVRPVTSLTKPRGGDIPTAKAIQSIRIPGFTALMRFATAVGNDPWVPIQGVVAASWLVALNRRRDALFVLVTLLLRLPNIALKRMAGRPRPTAEFLRILSTHKDLGFPSGHAGGALIFFGFLAYLAWLRINNPILRRATIAKCAVAPPMIGLSRIYLGAHWPSDVLGGYAYGGMMLGLLIEGHQWLERHSLGLSRNDESTELFGH
jgi:membrane-associated phospholipid phosphatase